MPQAHTLSQRWQKLKYKKTTAYSSENTIPENRGEAIPDDPPPPYDDPSAHSRDDDALSNNNPYPVMTKNAKSSSFIRRGRFLWIFVEIMAATFSTDIGSLKKAMVKTDPGWIRIMAYDPSSIWCEKGRKLVAETCALICGLERAMEQSRWLLVHPRDKYLVERIVLEPVRDFGMDQDFVLEVFGSFKRGLKCNRPESTLLDRWMESPHSTDLGDAIASHSLLLERLVLEDEVRVVLHDYIAAFQKREGIETMCTSEELQEESLAPGVTCCWPLSDGYVNLARGLRALKPTNTINDPYESSRARLRERRNVFNRRRDEDLRR